MLLLKIREGATIHKGISMNKPTLIESKEAINHAVSILMTELADPTANHKITHASISTLWALGDSLESILRDSNQMPPCTFVHENRS